MHGVRTHTHTHTHTHTQMLKLLSVGTSEPPTTLANVYTCLAVVGYALKHLSTCHISESDVHQQAIGLQLVAALQLLPYIHKGLTATDSSNEVCGGNSLSYIVLVQWLQW